MPSATTFRQDHAYTEGVPLDALRGDSLRGDALDSIWLQQELEALDATLHERKLPPLPLMSLIPIDYSGGEGLETTSFQTWDGRAEMKLMGAAADDAPIADFKRQKTANPVATYGSAVVFLRRELVQAQRMGLPLDPVADMLVQRAYYEKIEEHLKVGEPTIGMKGILNHPDIKAEQVKTAYSASTSAADIYAFLRRFTNAIADDSSDTFSASTLIVPSQMYRHMQDTYMTDQVNSETILERVEKRTGFSVTPAASLNSVEKAQLGIGSSGSVSCAIVANLDPMNMRKRIPHPLQRLEDQWARRRLIRDYTCDIGSLEVIQSGSVRTALNVWNNG